MSRLPALAVLLLSSTLLPACSDSPSAPGDPGAPGPGSYVVSVLDAGGAGRSVSGSPGGFIVNGGTDGVLWTRRNGAWELASLSYPRDPKTGYPDPRTPRISGVHVLDEDHAWATADGLVFTYTDGEWSTTVLPESDAGGEGVFAGAPDDVWVVGRNSYHFDGSTWSPVEELDGAYAIRSAGDGTLFAVGPFGKFLRKPAAADSFTVIETGLEARLYDVYPIHASKAFIVGDDGLCLSWSGSQVEPMDMGTTERLSAIDGTSPASIYVVGYGGVFRRFDGNEWGSLPNLGDVQAVGLHVARGDEIYATTIERGLLVFDGNSWSPARQGAPRGSYRGGFCLDTGEAWFAGATIEQGGVILHVDEGGETTPTYFPDLIRVHAVWGGASDDVWAAGWNGGNVVMLHHDGTSWSASSTAFTSIVVDMWGSGPQDIYAVGRDGLILHYAGTSWEQMQSGTSTFLRRVMGDGRSRVVAAGFQGLLLEFDGENWVDIPSPATSVTSIWLDDEGLLLSTDGTLYREREGGFDREELPALAGRGIWRSPEGNLFAVSIWGDFLSDRSGSWDYLVDRRPGQGAYYALCGPDESMLFAAGPAGVMRLDRR